MIAMVTMVVAVFVVMRIVPVRRCVHYAMTRHNHYRRRSVDRARRGDYHGCRRADWRRIDHARFLHDDTWRWTADDNAWQWRQWRQWDADVDINACARCHGRSEKNC